LLKIGLIFHFRVSPHAPKTGGMLGFLPAYAPTGAGFGPFIPYR
jgi:hypothetical protein